MSSEHLAKLEKMAKQAGYDDVNSFILENEMYDAACKVNDSLNRAFLPQDLMRGMRDDDFIKRYSDLALHYRIMEELYIEWDLAERFKDAKNKKDDK